MLSPPVGAGVSLPPSGKAGPEGPAAPCPLPQPTTIRIDSAAAIRTFHILLRQRRAAHFPTAQQGRVNALPKGRLCTRGVQRAAIGAGALSLPAKRVNEIPAPSPLSEA